jgi:hypothetical protein
VCHRFVDRALYRHDERTSTIILLAFTPLITIAVLLMCRLVVSNWRPVYPPPGLRVDYGHELHVSDSINNSMDQYCEEVHKEMRACSPLIEVGHTICLSGSSHRCRWPK